MPVTAHGNQLAGQGDMGGLWEWTSSPLLKWDGFEPMALYPLYTGTYTLCTWRYESEDDLLTFALISSRFLRRQAQYHPRRILGHSSAHRWAQVIVSLPVPILHVCEPFTSNYRC